MHDVVVDGQLHVSADGVEAIVAFSRSVEIENEVISFLVVSATLIGALVGSVILLFAT